MLVLNRKQGQRLDITITVLEVRGRRVRLGIEAPNQVHVVRAELCPWDDDAASRRGRHRDVVTAG